MLLHLGLQKLHGLALILTKRSTSRFEFGTTLAFELLQNDVYELFDRNDRILFAKFLKVVVECGFQMHKEVNISNGFVIGEEKWRPRKAYSEDQEFRQDLETEGCALLRLGTFPF